MLRRLGRFRVRVSSHQFGVRSTGTLLVRILVSASLAWGGYALSIVAGIADFSETISHLKWPTLLLAVPTFGFFIGAFVLSQFPLHKRMMDFKREELFRIEQVLEEFRSVEHGALTLEDRLKIEFYERKKDEILNLPDWPLGYQSVLAMGASTLAVLWPTLISPFLPAIERIVRSVVQG
jgi:hypothetical protein